MMIHNITPSVDDNKWLKRLDTELNETTKIQKKSLKLLGQRIRKSYHKTLGSCVESFPGPIRCFTVKENRIGSAVREILCYRQEKLTTLYNRIG